MDIEIMLIENFRRAGEAQLVQQTEMWGGSPSPPRSTKRFRLKLRVLLRRFTQRRLDC